MRPKLTALERKLCFVANANAMRPEHSVVLDEEFFWPLPGPLGNNGPSGTTPNLLFENQAHKYHSEFLAFIDETIATIVAGMAKSRKPGAKPLRPSRNVLVKAVSHFVPAELRIGKQKGGADARRGPAGGGSAQPAARDDAGGGAGRESDPTPYVYVNRLRK